MNTNIRGPDRPHLVGESATHPIEPRCGALAALLLLADLSPQRRLPCRARLRLQAQTVTQAGSMLPEFPAPPLPAPRIAAHSGASNCRFQVNRSAPW